MWLHHREFGSRRFANRPRNSFRSNLLLRSPHEDARQEDHPEKRNGELFIPRGDGPASLDSSEELLHQKTRLEDVAVMSAHDASTSARWNNSLGALRLDLRDHGIRIVAFIAEDKSTGLLFQHLRRLRDIVDLAFRKLDFFGVPETVHDSMYLGGRSAS